MAQDGKNGAVFAPWADPNEKPLIEFKSVIKRFGAFTAIKSIDLSIYTREFFALLGPSGCGKTTLMRMLAGFETPTEGVITLDGADIGRTPPNKRPVNMMFQSYALFPHLTVEQNIAFGLRRSDMPREQIPDRVQAMLKMVQLTKFAKRKPDQISGGQRQRVALARALAKAPKLLLLDEPLGALDKKLRQETQFELMDIQEKTGTTFVIVTHDQEEAMTVASRVAIMDEGVVRQVGTPTEVYEAPNSRFVADFVGEVNQIEGRVDARDGDLYHIAWTEGAKPLTLRSKRDIAVGDACCLALRPEKVDISAEEPTDSPNRMQGEVIDIAYLGAISTYHVRLDDGRIIKAQKTNGRVSRQVRFTWEERVWLAWGENSGVLLTE